jgi:YfiR/HmsC-like
LNRKMIKFRPVRHWAPKSILLVTIGVALLIPCAIALGAQNVDKIRTATIKAAYLRHLASLTTWPDSVSSQDAAPIQIVVLGPDPFDLAGILADNTAQTRVGPRALQVIRLPRYPEIEDVELATILERCQILFVTEAAEKDFPQLAPSLRHSPVLTVGETEDFTEKPGGMIGFFVDEGRVMIKARYSLAEASGLKLSAEFLQHAILVPSEKGGR